MKIGITLFGIFSVVCLTMPAVARDVSENPDRIPSIGVDLWKGQVAGIERSGDTNGGTVGISADYRRPVSNAITLHAFGETEGINNNLKYTSGYKVGVGLRVFIHQGAKGDK